MLVQGFEKILEFHALSLAPKALVHTLGKQEKETARVARGDRQGHGEGFGLQEILDVTLEPGLLQTKGEGLLQCLVAELLHKHHVLEESQHAGFGAFLHHQGHLAVKFLLQGDDEGRARHFQQGLEFLQKLLGALGPGQVLDAVAFDFFQVVHENQQGLVQARHDGFDDEKHFVFVQAVAFQAPADFLQVEARNPGNHHQHFAQKLGQEIRSVVQWHADTHAIKTGRNAASQHLHETALAHSRLARHADVGKGKQG